MQEWEKEVLMRRLDISGGSVLIKTAEQIEREQAQARIAAAQYYQKPLYGTPSEKKEFAERRKQQEDAMRQESFLKARQLKNVSKKQWVQKAKKDDEK
jgi:hypothetical protein